MLVRLEKKRAGLLAAGIWYLVLGPLCCDIPKLFCKREIDALRNEAAEVVGTHFPYLRSGLVGNGEGEHGTGGSYRGDDLVRRSACHSGILLYKKRKQTAFRDPACRASDRSDGDRGSRRDWRTGGYALGYTAGCLDRAEAEKPFRSSSDGAPFWKQCLRRQSWSGFWAACRTAGVKPSALKRKRCGRFRKVEALCSTMEKLRYDGAGKPHSLEFSAGSVWFSRPVIAKLFHGSAEGLDFTEASDRTVSV